MDVARDVHQTTAALASTNGYGLGVLTFTSY